MGDTIEIQPFESGFGCLITKWDPATPLRCQDVDTIWGAIEKHLVVVFRGQRSPTNEELIRFAQNFGELQPSWKKEQTVKGYELIALISNVLEDGRPIGTGGSGELRWHANYSPLERVAELTILDGTTVPVGQGATYWSDLYAAYDTLPKALKAQIADVQIHHWYGGYNGVEHTEPQRWPDRPEAIHALVRKNRRNGRPALFDPCVEGCFRVIGPDGYDLENGMELLAAVEKHATSAQFIYRHDWHIGDLVVWDNIGTLHRRDGFDETQTRLMRRIDIAEPEPSGYDPRRSEGVSSLASRSPQNSLN